MLTIVFRNQLSWPANLVLDGGLELVSACPRGVGVPASGSRASSVARVCGRRFAGHAALQRSPQCTATCIACPPPPQVSATDNGGGAPVALGDAVPPGATWTYQYLVLNR